MNKAKVAIVIVCMNNMKNLVTCLDSIAKCTKIEHEVWVNAYMFTDENLKIAQEKYPYVHWVINNIIAGFAENNNMILRQINAEYALVLNDDTELKESMIDRLVYDMEKHKNISIISPVIYYPNGDVQHCGRNPISMLSFILEDMSITHLERKSSKYINQKGLFQTYNISGACFLIRMEVFHELGFFDDYYFFSPEDTALSTLANHKGYQCWVDAHVGVIHYSGQSHKSWMKTATLPALRLGAAHFWGKGNVWKTFILRLLIFSNSLLKSFYFILRNDKVEKLAQWHCCITIFSKLTPKEAFIKFYRQNI